MHNCSHHYDLQNVNPFHMEGDVWVHTMMVCKQSTTHHRNAQIAALLHDIGKPATREINPKNNHVRFLNHDAVSAFMALEVLKNPYLHLETEDIVEIFNLIALHTQVYKQDENQLRETLRGQPDLANRLVQLGRADDAGRFSNLSKDILPLYDIPEKHENLSKKSVTLLCGLPGSGKSSSIKGDSFIVSRDHLITRDYPDLTYNEAWKQVDQKQIDRQLQELYLASKSSNDVVVDMTHMSKKSRRKSLSHYGKDWEKNCVVFLPTLKEIEVRNENREGKTIGKHVIDKMMRSFYPPTYEEFNNIRYVL